MNRNAKRKVEHETICIIRLIPFIEFYLILVIHESPSYRLKEHTVISCQVLDLLLSLNFLPNKNKVFQPLTNSVQKEFLKQNYLFISS